MILVPLAAWFADFQAPFLPRVKGTSMKVWRTSKPRGVRPSSASRTRVSPPTEPLLKAAMTGLMGGERSGRLAHITKQTGARSARLYRDSIRIEEIEHSSGLPLLSQISRRTRREPGELATGDSQVSAPYSAEDFLNRFRLFVTSSGYRLKEIGSSEFTLSSWSCVVQNAESHDIRTP